MRYLTLTITFITFFNVAAAFAFGLSETDYNYLETQKVERTSVLLHNLSPKEQAWLHALINDEKTKSDPIAHAQNVNDALAQFSANQLWERQNPGQLWDASRK
jgi:hypothetical protein